MTVPDVIPQMIVRILGKTIFLGTDLAFDSKGDIIENFMDHRLQNSAIIEDEDCQLIAKHFGILAYIDFIFLKLVAVVTEIQRQSEWPHVLRVIQILFIPVYTSQLPVTIDEKEFVTVTKREYFDQLVGTIFGEDIDILGNVVGPPTDDKYFWNKHALGPLLKYGIRVFNGFVETVRLATTPADLEMTIISRISALAQGKRYWNRGLNEDNYCEELETVVMLCTPNLMTCYKLFSGSVPLKWTQHPETLSPPKIKYSDDFNTECAFRDCEKYFESLGLVNIVDLIPRDGNVGNFLSMKYQEFTSCFPYVGYYRDVAHIPDQSFSMTNNGGFSVLQKSFCRVNNIDIDDTVWFAQYKIAKSVLAKMAKEFPEVPADKREYRKAIAQPFKQLWIRMADCMTKYTMGTGINKSKYRVHYYDRLLSPILSAKIGISRYYLGMFQDFGAHDAINTFHGRFPPGYESVPCRIKLRTKIIFMDYSTSLFTGAILMIKRYASPRKIDNPTQFVLACLWYN